MSMHVWNVNAYLVEGVETDDQLSYLRSSDCDEVQGFYFSRPLAADQFAEAFLREIAILWDFIDATWQVHQAEDVVYYKQTPNRKGALVHNTRPRLFIDH